ncbi:MAG: DNA polymerase III subunit gamma/tau [Gammaproteobacteria bacterium]|nr:DNA polymerase III subunit gamma/tau [Gammaproteobacteria bacterium]
MSYKALYRKYRPQSFADVKDQDHITRTLKNALKEARVSHAYLFSGPRGIGKTSIAKIFAKAVNCTHNMSGEPCNNCDICNGITNGSISDVIEIDAASNNGVDEIRELRDKVKYLPSLCKYKVYIIDEVHMLTTQAFNALLKTLEEPPKHVIFILCTTEAQKVPQTIQSRCQRFEFHLIGEKEIEDRIKEIARYEYMKIDEDALKAIAELSEGGMRDALSLLDQVDAYSKDQHITINDVLEVSGKVSNDTLVKLSKSLNDGSALEAITLLDDLLKMGKEIPKIMSSLVVFYKDILVIKNVKPDLMKAGYDSDEFKYLVNSITNQTLYKNIDILSEAISNMRYAENQRLYTELALIKMADGEAQRLIDLDETKKNIEPKKEVKPIIKEEVKPAPQVEVKPVVQEVVKPKEEVKPVVKEEIKVEPVIKEEVKPQVVENVNPVIKEKVDSTVSSITKEKGTFDITIIENILNAAHKSFKEELIQVFPGMLKNSRGTDYHRVAMILEEAKIGAASKESVIFTFDDVSYCNLIMKKDNKENISKLLSKTMGREYSFIAIPTETWKIISDEFIQKFRANVQSNNKVFIHLTPVFVEGLRINPQEETEAKREENDKFKDLKNSFKDIIEVK